MLKLTPIGLMYVLQFFVLAARITIIIKETRCIPLYITSVRQLSV